jgi:DNA-binding transcriptional LysR family regulator
MAESTITAKVQTTVPADIRALVGAKPVTRLVWSAMPDGMGIGFSPTWLFEDEMAPGDLQVLLPGWPAQPIPVHLVSPSQRRQAAKVKAFADHVVAAQEK